MVVRVRHLWNKVTREVQFYKTRAWTVTLLNWDGPSVSIGVLRMVSIGQWMSLSMKMRARDRTGHAPQNLALLRRIALNALNREQSLKRSNRQKSHRAAMDNNYMLKILAACLSQHDDVSQSACQ